jgi:hypothetical protein
VPLEAAFDCWTFVIAHRQKKSGRIDLLIAHNVVLRINILYEVESQDNSILIIILEHIIVSYYSPGAFDKVSAKSGTCRGSSRNLGGGYLRI